MDQSKYLSNFGDHSKLDVERWLEKKCIVCIANGRTACRGNSAQELSAIIELFKLANKVGYFLADNATNNDHAIQILGQKYRFTLNERRL